MRTQPYKLLLVEDNQVSLLVVQAMLKNVETATFDVVPADCLLKALDLIAKDKFDVALVDLNLPDSNGLETFLAIQRHSPTLPIVILSGSDSEVLAIKAVELGAQDFLSKVKLNRDELIRAIQHGIIRSRKSAGEQRATQAEGGVVAFLGSKGGVGVTTLACHTARELKRETGEEILLLGLDTTTAGVSYLMKIQSEYTLADATESLHRLDAALWKRLVTATPDHIDVLPPPGAAQFAGQLSPERLNHIVRFARGIYARVVIDLGVPGPLSLGLLEEVTCLYVVASEDLVALWEAGRLLARLTQLGLTPERVRFIVNQKKKRGGLDTADLEKAFRYPVHATVAEAGEEQTELRAAGRFVDVKSQVHKDTARFVAKLLGKDTPAGPRSPFSFARLGRS